MLMTMKNHLLRRQHYGQVQTHGEISHGWISVPAAVPICLTLYKHMATVDGKTVLVDFWDTAGQAVPKHAHLLPPQGPCLHHGI